MKRWKTKLVTYINCELEYKKMCSMAAKIDMEKANV